MIDLSEFGVNESDLSYVNNNMGHIHRSDRGVRVKIIGKSIACFIYIRLLAMNDSWLLLSGPTSQLVVILLKNVITCKNCIHIYVHTWFFPPGNNEHYGLIMAYSMSCQQIIECWVNNWYKIFQWIHIYSFRITSNSNHHSFFSLYNWDIHPIRQIWDKENMKTMQN